MAAKTMRDAQLRATETFGRLRLAMASVLSEAAACEDGSLNKARLSTHEIERAVKIAEGLVVELEDMADAARRGR